MASEVWIISVVSSGIATGVEVWTDYDLAYDRLQQIRQLSIFDINDDDAELFCVQTDTPYFDSDY